MSMRQTRLILNNKLIQLNNPSNRFLQMSINESSYVFNACYAIVNTNASALIEQYCSIKTKTYYNTFSNTIVSTEE